MSKLSKINKAQEDNSYTELAYAYVNEHLPATYVELTIACITKKGQPAPSKSLVRNVRNKTIFRNDILLALVEVAKENKEAIEKIKLLIS